MKPPKHIYLISVDNTTLSGFWRTRKEERVWNYRYRLDEPVVATEKDYDPLTETVSGECDRCTKTVFHDDKYCPSCGSRLKWKW